MHYPSRSRFFIDSLSTMGFSSPYPEVQRFKENVDCLHAPDVLDSDTDTSLLFAGDDVDHNIITLDGKSTSHGIGMKTAITPQKQASRILPR